MNNVLSNLSNNNITEEIKKCIKFLYESLELYNKDKCDTDILTSIENNLEELTDHAGSIDNANGSVVNLITNFKVTYKYFSFF